MVEQSNNQEMYQLEYIKRMITPKVGIDVANFISTLVYHMFSVKNIPISNIKEIRVRSNNIDYQMYIKLHYTDLNGNDIISYIPIVKPIKYCVHNGTKVIHFRNFKCKYAVRKRSNNINKNMQIA